MLALAPKLHEGYQLLGERFPIISRFTILPPGQWDHLKVSFQALHYKAYKSNQLVSICLIGYDSRPQALLPKKAGEYKDMFMEHENQTLGSKKR